MMKEGWKQIAFDMAAGLRIKDLANKFGYTHQYICQLRQNKSFQKLLKDAQEQIKEAKIKEAVNYREALESIVRFGDKYFANVSEVISACDKLAKLDGAYAPEKHEIKQGESFEDIIKRMRRERGLDKPRPPQELE